MPSISFFVVPGFHLLDLTGPYTAFREACAARPGAYRLRVLSPAGGLVMSETGLAVETEPADAAGQDTLVIIGGRGPREASESDEITALADALCRDSDRVASVCTGAFLLAATGRLDGRRATTHWRHSARLQQRFPAVKVEADCIFIEDGAVWSSAGITAGIDLALALIEADLGADAARGVARDLVVYNRRLGSQAQFSAALGLEPETDRMRRAWAFAREHLHEPLSVERLAEAASLSPRQFARAFRAETGQTPAKAVERLRVEAARSRLEAGREPVEGVAASVGFASAERMRRAFLRVLGQSPQAIKRGAHAARRAPV